MKFRDVAERYLKLKTKRGNDKSTSAQAAIRKLIDRWGNRSVASIRRVDINDLQEELLWRKDSQTPQSTRISSTSG